MRRLPSLNGLRAFEAAGRHGRMSLAAEELNVTHSAVSRQVQQLEDVLGVPLFEGPKNAIRLTEAGRALLPGLTAGFDQLQVAVARVATRRSSLIDLACSGTLAMRWLIPRLHIFKEQHPEIEVRLTACDHDDEFARIDFDLALRVGAGPWPSGLVTRTLFAERTGPVLSPAIARLIPQDIAGLPILHTRTRPHAWAQWAAASGERNPASELEDTAAAAVYQRFYYLLEATTAGLGVAIGPWPLVAGDIAAGRLVAPFGFCPSGNDYIALWRPRQTAALTLLLDWLFEEAERFERTSPPPFT
ncbi:DNA-binding transcriptional LysR family regulator [Rhodopseudomonas julia]|uniref:DNA-binding transcriptional LysR family regulator n=1 Tax=Rhodopseudomonas julia TaxID=200617 RepID=A0ABU0C4M9_9BRAD|nr:LysR substrate-binding domain-containing protein [Rhodopseudomonas julia]MDQ0325467.1 DNA-binding transcriptional LysR family regulator [Rhodopseudomonas julia]